MSKQYTYKIGGITLFVLLSQIILWGLLLFGIWFAQDNYTEFRLEHKVDLIYGLVIIPFIVIHINYLRWKNKAINRFSNTNLQQHSLSPISSLKTGLKMVCLYSSIALLFIAYLNPQFGTKEKESEVKGIDIIVALDVSNSMLARDLDKTKTRLDIAKRAIESMSNKLHGDRFGIVVFAGKAFTQLPITTDYSAAKLFLSTISTDMIQTQGTAIGNAIEVSLNSLDFESNTQKAIVIISDGENHEDDAIDMTKVAQEKGVAIHTIGMGSVNGSPIPMYRKGKFVNNKRDKEGHTVLTKLNEQMLKDIADAGNGIYIKANKNNLGLDIILDNLNELEKEAYDTKQYLEYEDQFQWFLLLAILLFIGYITIDENTKLKLA